MKIPSLKKMIKSNEAAAPASEAKKVAAKKVAAKKAVKKVAAKKAPVKKTATKKSGSKRLVVASDSESFWVTNGHVLNSLVALEIAFKTMTKSDYAYHISESGSDFADWVETVLQAPECAVELRKAKTAKAAGLVVTKYLKEHQL